MKKRFLFAASLAATLGAQAQAVLVVDTAMATSTSPAGRAISVAAAGTSGYTMSGPTFSVAEDFIVPTGELWRVDSLIVFGYQTGTVPPANPFTSARVQIYSDTAGGVMIGGDTTTNRLATAQFSGIYRINTGTATTDTARAIYRIAMRVPATTPAQLPAGTYWIAWNATTTPAGAVFAVPKTLASGNPAGQNARQRNGTVWAPITFTSGATTSTIGLNMILKGIRTPTSVGQAPAAGKFALYTPYPNPAESETNLSFSIGTASRVSLQIVNALGQRVATVVEDEMTPGDYLIPYSTSGLAAGSYTILLQTAAGKAVMPLTVK